MSEDFKVTEEKQFSETKPQPVKKTEYFWKITTVVLIVILAVVAFRGTPGLTGGATVNTGAEVTPEAQPSVVKIDLAADDVIKGNAKAPVTMIIYSDPSCPFCGAAAGGNQQVIDYLKQRDPSWVAPLPPIMDTYVKSGQVKVVFRYFPGHGTGETAMKILLCANEQGKFWELHDKVFQNQDVAADEAKVKDLARSVGADVDKINSCLTSKKYDQKIAKDTASGRAIGVQGTPDFFINGKEVGGAQSYSAFQSIIEAALKS